MTCRYGFDTQAQPQASLIYIHQGAHWLHYDDTMTGWEELRPARHTITRKRQKRLAAYYTNAHQYVGKAHISDITRGLARPGVIAGTFGYP